MRRYPGVKPNEYGLNTVKITLCDACLDGVGGECHTPGCACWMSTAPDVALRDNTEPA